MKIKKTKKISKLKLIIIISAIIYVCYGLWVSYARAMQINRAVSSQNALQQSVDTMSVPELIDYFSPRFGANKELVKKVAFCESGYRVASHDGGKAVNATAIHDTTFQMWLPQYEKDTGETLNLKSNVDSVKMMVWAFGKGEEYRNDWTTYVAYQKGGLYTFIDRYGVKHTARCK